MGAADERAEQERAVSPKRRREAGGGKADALKTIAGLVAVVVGVAAILAIALAAISKNSQIGSTIATGTAGVIGSIVGAYLGIKLGSDRTREATSAQREEAAKAQTYALHVPESKAEKARKDADEAARAARSQA